MALIRSIWHLRSDSHEYMRVAYFRVCARIFVCMYVSMYLCIYVCMCVCVCVYVCVCVCVCMCVYDSPEQGFRACWCPFMRIFMNFFKSIYHTYTHACMHACFHEHSTFVGMHAPCRLHAVVVHDFRIAPFACGHVLCVYGRSITCMTYEQHVRKISWKKGSSWTLR